MGKAILFVYLSTLLCFLKYVHCYTTDTSVLQQAENKSKEQSYEEKLISDQIIKTLLQKKRTEKYKSFDIVSPNVSLPETGTTYWCSVRKLPDFSNRVHGVGFESIISEQSRSKIHHMEVFGCDVDDGEIPSYSGNCESLEMPRQLTRCRHVLAAWAFGAKALFYPKEAGLQFYSSRKSQYVRLEIHYNNPEHERGVLDSSGIRFFYTERFRKYNVGVLEAGVIYTPDMAIPPRQNSFRWPGVCPLQCTEQALPLEGVNIFASQLHAHLAGRRIWTSIYRNGRKVDEIDRDDEYSTWKELIHPVFPMKKILPGDNLVVTCDFKTKDRNNVTIGGLGIREEMCVTYLHYYPETNLEVCKSSVSNSALNGFLALQSLLQNAPVRSYKEVEWSYQAINRLKLLYNLSPLNVHCLKQNGEFWGGKWNEIPQFII